MRADLPTGTVTFLFTDVEGSTRVLERLGDSAYADALALHRARIVTSCETHNGVVVDTEGDAVFVAFAAAPDALAAAAAIQEQAADEPLQVRVGLHTGAPVVAGSGYVGIDVHRAARIAAAAHGGQVVLSASTRSLLGATVPLRDVGEHRLKDLAAAERLYQLGDREFPPLRSLGRTNLPVPSTPFVGRAGEVAEVVALLRRSDARLVTLTGPGGTGKTRLALQAAAEVADEHPDGIWWVSLAPLREPALALESVAHTLGVVGEPGRALAETLATRLRQTHALVMLDNAEHLLPELAGDLASLVSACPTLKLLATSRERIQIAAETAWPVPPLAAGDAEGLFRERARSAGVMLSANGTIAELCRRLDQLPLAIELAAARTVVFSPDQLLDRLTQRLDLLKGGRDADPRQQTLRAAIDWSFELLDDEEQRVFRELSVFAGGCTYEAAADVVGADPDTLQSLIDKSLVRRRDTEQGPRYWMLETIRAYASDALDATADAAALRRRHADWIRGVARAQLGYPGSGIARGASADEFAAFHDDYDNARAALAWARDTGDDERFVGLGAACGRYWLGGGLFRDAVHWLDEADRRFPSTPPETRLQALKIGGAIAFFVRADTDRAEALWLEADVIANELGLPDESAWLGQRLTGVAWERGDLQGAIAGHTTLLEYYRSQGNRAAEADTLHNLGETYRDAGDFDQGERLLLDAQAAYLDAANEVGLANNTHSLADLALDRGEFEAAIELYRRTLDRGLIDGGRLLAYCVAGTASALAGLGRDPEAARAWGAVCAAEESSGFRMIAPERRRYEAHLARIERTDDWLAGRELSLEDVFAALTSRG